MIAVVTGGSGFIGRNLTARLIKDGHTARCLVRRTNAAIASGAERHVVDFTDPRSLDSSPALDGADVVFHLAGATKGASESQFSAANLTPTRHLLDALVARRLRPRFVFVSSQAAGGPASAPDSPVTESDPPHPVESYGRSKLAAEESVRQRSGELPFVIVRPCAVFGPRDRDVFSLFRMAGAGVAIYPGIERQWVSLLHVDDVVSGLLAAGEHDAAAGRLYYLASAAPVQWRTVVDMIGAAMGQRVRHVNVPDAVVRIACVLGDVIGRVSGRPLLANSQKAALAREEFWVCSSERARSEIGFRESRSLPDALRDTYYWYRQNGWLRASLGVAPTAA